MSLVQQLLTAIEDRATFNCCWCQFGHFRMTERNIRGLESNFLKILNTLKPLGLTSLTKWSIIKSNTHHVAVYKTIVMWLNHNHLKRWSPLHFSTNTITEKEKKLIQL